MMKNESGIIPIGDRAVVYVPELEEKTDGGIILPDQLKTRQDAAQEAGTLIARGSTCDAQLEEFPDIGAKVLITKYAGNSHKGVDGKMYKVVRGDDIIAKMEKSNG